MPRLLSELLPAVLEKIQYREDALPKQAMTPEQQAEESARASLARDEYIQQQTQSLMRLIGPRYHNATLDNYEAPNKHQEAAVAQLRAYAQNLRAEVKAGHGILLFGTTGTGKDHLLIGLAREVIAAGCSLSWVNGVDLQTKMRDAIRDDVGEDYVLGKYKAVRVLVLSDPMPPSGVLTDYQATTLYRLIDYRYRHLLPVWCSLNVADAKEARARLGAATVDRLRDGALAIECKWSSYRKAQRPGAIDRDPSDERKEPVT